VLDLPKIFQYSLDDRSTGAYIIFIEGGDENHSMALYTISSNRYAIRDGEGYWFQHFLEGEVFFDSPQETAQQYDTVAAAIIDRDALAQLLMDDSLSIRQVAPIEPVVVTRGEDGKFISQRIQQDHAQTVAFDLYLFADPI
jgi:hypothetical protein